MPTESAESTEGVDVIHEHPKCGKVALVANDEVVDVIAAYGGFTVCGACGRRVMLQPNFDLTEWRAIS